MSEQNYQQPQQPPVQPQQPPVQPQQPQQQQPPMQLQKPPIQAKTFPDPTKEVMSVGSYIGMFILSEIPIVNIICWIVWLVSPNTNKNKKNYCIATIVLWLIGVVIYVILAVILAAAGVDFAAV